MNLYLTWRVGNNFHKKPPVLKKSILFILQLFSHVITAP